MRKTFKINRPAIPAIKSKCGGKKGGCNYEGEATLITKIKIAA